MLPYENLSLASDIEAKGFWDDVNSIEDIHCLCSIDITTGNIYLFHNHPEFDGVKVIDSYDNKEYVIPPRNGDLEEGIKWWSKVANNGGKLIVHNAHTYDRPICDKIWNNNAIPFESWHDTFIQSKLQWYERPTPKGCKSAHGLKAYGIRCGVNKPEITDWTYIDAFKLHRCIEDCKIQQKTYEMLEKEATFLKTHLNIDFKSALKIESLYADCCFKQEVVGVKVDVDHINKCLIDLDTKISKLIVEIEPQLPPTIKPKKGSKRVSRSEVAALLGYDNSKIKDKIIKKRLKGEIVSVEEKPYIKPTVNFTNKDDVITYSGFNISYGESPSFSKKKDMNQWVKDNYPDTKPKDWNIEKIVTEGLVLDNHTCNHFGCNPRDTDLIVGAYTKISIEPSTLSQSEVVKSFLITLGWKDAEEWNLKTDFENNYIKVEKDTWVCWPSKASPENQIKKLVKKGEFLVSSPQLSESDYEQLPEGVGKKIAEYNTYVHRRNFLENKDDPENKGILSYVRPDGRIPAGVNNFATRSGRGSQRVWVNAPSEGALYGDEIRKCIIPEKGKSLVGIDMKSAQLSIAAYYANNYEYYNNVATGIEYDENDNYVGQTAHCVNARMFGMVSEEEWMSAVKNQDKDKIHHITLQRKKSKGGSFCVPKDNTEVLTENGWKSFKDLHIGLKVLSYNIVKGINEFTPIEHIVEFKDKPVLSMGNSNWSVESTKEHRWFGKRRTGKGTTRREVDEFITTDNIKSEFKLINSAPKEDLVHSRLTPNESAILGWLLAEGSIQWKPYSERTSSSFGKKRGVKAVIHQSESKYITELEALLNVEDAYTGYTTTPAPSGLIRRYNVRASYVRYLFDKAELPCEDKHTIDYTELALNLNNESLESFLHAFWLADGTTESDGGISICQNLGNICDFVQLCFTLTGTNFTVQYKKDYYGSKHTCVAMRVKKKQHTSSTKFIKEYTRDTDVFCITTKNSTFVMRQGDIVTITGNCVIFGGSGAKVAKTIGIPEKEGNSRKKQFLNQMGLDNTINSLKDYENTNKYKSGFMLPVAFGYWLYNNSSHKSVNTIVQGFEALAQKLAVIRLSKESIRLGLDDKFVKVLDVHDEVLLEVEEGYEKEVGTLAGECYTWAADQIFKYHKRNPNHFANPEPPTFAIDLNGGFKVGKNYLETH